MEEVAELEAQVMHQWQCTLEAGSSYVIIKHGG
jgi:hypothetical protein